MLRSTSYQIIVITLLTLYAEYNSIWVLHILLAERLYGWFGVGGHSRSYRLQKI